MTDSSDRRRGGFVPIARLRPPSGGPAKLYERARLARVRELLGPAIGPQLVEMVDEGTGIQLVFAGRGWERALEGERARLSLELARRLGRPRVELSVRSRPEADPVARPASPLLEESAERSREPLDREELRERLSRLGARFAERRRDAGDER